MVEQLGIVYPRCVDGYHHCPEGTDVRIVNKYGNYVEDGSTGLIQSISLLKNSYPTHSVLTEDLGYLVTGKCSCGRDSKRFKVLGRVALSEVRGAVMLIKTQAQLSQFLESVSNKTLPST